MTEKTDVTGTAGEPEASGDDLEAALAEFDQAVQPEPERKPETPKVTASDIAEELKKNREFRERQEKRDEETEYRTDMDQMVKSVKGEAEANPDYVEWWLNNEAKKDSRLNTAWMQRRNNPAAFEKVVADLGKRFAEAHTTTVDQVETDTQEAVMASVRSVSTKPQEEKPLTKADVRGMSREDLNKKMVELGAKPV